MPTYSSIEVKTGTNHTTLSAACDHKIMCFGPAMFAPNKELKTQVNTDGSTATVSQVRAQVLEKRDTTDNPDNFTTVFAGLDKKVAYGSIGCIVRDMAYQSPCAGQTTRITDSDSRTLYNQKMRGGIAG